MDNQLWQQSKDFKNKKEDKKMERVGKYYGVRLIDAIKFAWLDAIFAVERKIDMLHRNRVQRAALETNVAAEVTALVDHEAPAATATESERQEVPANTD